MTPKITARVLLYKDSADSAKTKGRPQVTFRALSLSMLVLQVLGLILLAGPVFAAGIAQKASKSAWSMATSIGRTSSLYVNNDGNQSSSVDFAVAPSVALGPDYTLSALIESSQDLVREEYDYGRGLLTLTKSSGYTALNKRIKITPYARLSLPLSKLAKAASLQVGTSLGGRFDVNPDFLISKKLGLGLLLSLTRNFHNYDTAIDGTVNTQYSSVQAFETSWAFSDRWNFTFTLGHYDTISYQGVAKDYLSHSEEVSFKANSRLSFTAGHAWGNPYVSSRRADGRDINFAVNDDRNSLVYAQMGFLF